MNASEIRALVTAADALACIADKSPLYFHRLVRLSPQAAQVLATHEYGLSFPMLRVLLPSAAQALASHVWGLHLEGLTQISRRTGDALARHVGPLYLAPNRLKCLESAALAKRLAYGREEGRVRKPILMDNDDGEEEVIGEDAEEKGPALPTLQLPSVRHLSPRVAEALSCGVFLPSLRVMTPELAAAFAEGHGTLELRGLGTGFTRICNAARDILATTHRLLVFGDESTVQSQYYSNHNIELLSCLLRSLSVLRDANRERDECLHEFVFHLKSLTLAEAEAFAQITVSGRVWLHVAAPISEECEAVCAESAGCIFTVPHALTDSALAAKLADQIVDCVGHAGELPFSEVSPSAMLELVRAANSFEESSLSLPNLMELTPDLARALASLKQRMTFANVMVIDDESAAALVEHCTYEDEADEELRRYYEEDHQRAMQYSFGRRELAFPNLLTLSPTAALHLCKWVGTLSLCGLAPLPEGIVGILASRNAGRLKLDKKALSQVSEGFREAVRRNPLIEIY